MSKLLLNKYQNVHNKKLLELLKKIEIEPIFYGEQRLLSESEVINYKKELGIMKENIIPLIDCLDNEFLVFDLLKKEFKMYNMDDDIIYNSKTIEPILKKCI